MSQCHDVYNQSDFPPAKGHACHFVSRIGDHVHVVRVVGSLDWASQGEFDELVRSSCDKPILIVDLTACRMDAAGTGALVIAAEAARERRQQLVFVVTDPLQRSVMISTGLNLTVPIVSSEEAAVTWCERHGVQPWALRSGSI